MDKECPGVNDLCCNPIPDWEDYCESCMLELERQGKDSELENLGDYNG